MLFLLNDALITLDGKDAPPLDAGRFRALSLPFLLKLGAEMFAADPLMHQTNPERAKRLATLIKSKNPQVNAALFVAPARNCPVDQVISRVAEVSLEVMGSLHNRAKAGDLNPVTADREVWRRMAA
ncbi:hypothetical protein BH09PSE2_BH09PSE2_12160 [soil metagenome]